MSPDLTTSKATKTESFLCVFCFLDLQSLSVASRTAHYDQHLAVERKEGSRLVPIDVEDMPEIMGHSQNNSIKGRTSKKNFRLVKETDTFWHVGLNTPPPRNHVPGLIHILRKGLLKGHNRGSVRRSALCAESAVLIHREAWDASWGCGYRNFLMACATLLNQQTQLSYFSLLDSPTSPSIRNLQSWIENAWEQGFDPEGKKDLKKLIGTHKWIGTADIWVAFCSRRIPAQLVDFDLRNKSEDVLVDWVVEYFTPKSQEKASNVFETLRGSSVVTTDKMPLILQHDGHSRTVVGYEIDQKGGTNLLVFDPAYSPSPEIRVCALAEYAKSKMGQEGGSSESPTKDHSSSVVGAKRKRSSNDNPHEAAPLQSTSSFRNNLSKFKFNHNTKTDLDLYGVLKKFRLEPKKLQKKKLYQILYFPLTEPLTEKEKMQRKHVTSIKIT